MFSVHTLVIMYARTTRRIADAIAILCIVVGVIFGLARGIEKRGYHSERHTLVSHGPSRQQLGCWLARGDDGPEAFGSSQAP